jgi:hypothetical protein
MNLQSYRSADFQTPRAARTSMNPLIDWTWKPLTESTECRSAAAYAVRLLNRRVVVSIPRFLGVDVEGILTIGMTTNFERRRRGFIRGSTKGRGHSSANLLFFLATNKAYGVSFAEPSCEICFCPVASKQAALGIECQITREYLARFGEAPPLTSVIPDRYAHLQKG